MLYRKIFIRPGDGYFRDYTETAQSSRTNYRLHVILFLLTILTTTCCGAYMAGRNPFTSVS